MSSLVRLPALALPTAGAAAGAAESFGSKPCTPQAVDLMLEHVFGCLANSLDEEGGSFFGSACTDASSVDIAVSIEGTWLGEMPIGLVAADAGARARLRRRDLRREQMARMPRDNAQRAATAAAALWLAELPVGAAPRHHRARVRPVRQCFVCHEHPGVAVDMMQMPMCRCFACRACLESFLFSTLSSFAPESYRDAAAQPPSAAVVPVRCFGHASHCGSTLSDDFVLDVCRRAGGWLLGAFCDAQFARYVLDHSQRPREGAAARGGLFRCPLPGCGAPFVCGSDDALDAGAASASSASSISCSRCVGDMCADCLAGAHPALSCAEAAAKRRGDIDALLGAVRAISADGGAQQCPYCDVVVERTEGCNFMACTCGHAFCYVCGDKLDIHYQPIGKSRCECGSFGGE